MAEVIGLVSGLYTLGIAGLRLSNALWGLSKDIESAEYDVNHVASEIKSTSDIVLLIKQSLDGSEKSKSDIVQKGITLLPDLTTQCEFCFERIRELVTFLEPYAPSSDEATGLSRALVPQGARYGNIKFLSKLKWQKRRPQVQKVRSYLEGLKSNLHLLLSLLKHEIAVEKQQPESMRGVLREELQKAFEGVQVVPKTIDENIASDCATAAASSSGSQALISRRFMAARPQQAVQTLALQVLRPQRRRESASLDGVRTSDPAAHSPIDAPWVPCPPPKSSSVRFQDVDPGFARRQRPPKEPPFTSPKNPTSFYESVPSKDGTTGNSKAAVTASSLDEVGSSSPSRTSCANLGTGSMLAQSFADTKHGLYGKDVGPNATLPDDLQAHSGYSDEEDGDSDLEEHRVFYLGNESTEAVICSADQSSIRTRTEIFERGLRGKRRSLRKWAEDRDVEIIANLSDRTRSPSPG